MTTPATSPHILIVDDDADIRSLLADYLGEQGWHISTAQDGPSMQQVLDAAPVDLIVLDLTLPGSDGLTLCRDLRAHSAVPVIMLTARDEEVDRVLGLELGADDYVPKPFSPRELAARVKAVLRRTQPQASTGDLTIADVRLSRDAREATRAGVPLDLTMKEFDLLACFLENAGLALTREQLLEQVWGLEFPGGTRTVDQHVAQVRAKLGDGLQIETLRGVGYKLVKP